MNTRNQKPNEDWEARLSRKLADLPDREAPSTLVPRVLAAVQAKARLPWYRRTWWHWPPAAQVFALVLLSGLLGGITWLGLQVGQGDWGLHAERTVSGWLQPLAPFWSCFNSVVNALALALRQLNAWIVFGAVAVCLGMYLSCLGVGTVVYRMTVNKSHL